MSDPEQVFVDAKPEPRKGSLVLNRKDPEMQRGALQVAATATLGAAAGLGLPEPSQPA